MFETVIETDYNLPFHFFMQPSRMCELEIVKIDCKNR